MEELGLFKTNRAGEKWSKLFLEWFEGNLIELQMSHAERLVWNRILELILLGEKK